MHAKDLVKWLAYSNNQQMLVLRSYSVPKIVLGTGDTDVKNKYRGLPWWCSG